MMITAPSGNRYVTTNLDESTLHHCHRQATIRWPNGMCVIADELTAMIRGVISTVAPTLESNALGAVCFDDDPVQCVGDVLTFKLHNPHGSEKASLTFCGNACTHTFAALNDFRVRIDHESTGSRMLEYNVDGISREWVVMAKDLVELVAIMVMYSNSTKLEASY